MQNPQDSVYNDFPKENFLYQIYSNKEAKDCYTSNWNQYQTEDKKELFLIKTGNLLSLKLEEEIWLSVLLSMPPVSSSLAWDPSQVAYMLGLQTFFFTRGKSEQ